jgi:hypothetical protein
MALKNVTSKEIRIDEWQKEIRWFAESDDGFDGTAGGHGYKSPEKLRKAYWYHQNRHIIKANESMARRFLEENSELRKLLCSYFSADNHLIAAKDGETLKFETLLADLRNDTKIENKEEMIRGIEEAKPLWKSILMVLP